MQNLAVDRERTSKLQPHLKQTVVKMTSVCMWLYSK